MRSNPNPRWSVAKLLRLLPASIAGEFSKRAIVSVTPPLFCNSPNSGSIGLSAVPIRLGSDKTIPSPLPIKLLLPDNSPRSTISGVPASPLFATMVLESETLPVLLLTIPPATNPSTVEGVLLAIVLLAIAVVESFKLLLTIAVPSLPLKVELKIFNLPELTIPKPTPLLLLIVLSIILVVPLAKIPAESVCLALGSDPGPSPEFSLTVLLLMLRTESSSEKIPPLLPNAEALLLFTWLFSKLTVESIERIPPVPISSLFDTLLPTIVISDSCRSIPVPTLFSIALLLTRTLDLRLAIPAPLLSTELFPGIEFSAIVLLLMLAEASRL